MLTKETVVDRIEITEHGAVQVRRATYIVENGQRIAGPIYHRSAYEPGASIDTEDDRVKAIAAVAWTPEVVQAHRARRAEDTPQR